MVNHRNTLGTVDIGAAASCLSEKFAKKCGIRVIKNSPRSQNLYSAEGKKLNVVEIARVNVTVGNFKVAYNFHVVAKLNHPILFGINFLRAFGCKIDLQNDCVLFNNGSTVLPLQNLDSSMFLFKSSEHIILPPQTEALISVKLTNRTSKRFHSQYAIVEPFITAQQRGFYVARALIKGPDNNKLTCCLFNPWTKICKIPRNFIVATLSSVVVTGNQSHTDNIQPSQQSACTSVAHEATYIRPTQTDGCKQQTVDRPTPTCVAGSTNVGMNGRSCSCYSADSLPTVKTDSLLVGQQQQNLPRRDFGRTDSCCFRCSEKENICSVGSQQDFAADGRMVSDTLPEHNAARLLISEQQSGSTTKAQIPLSEKVEHLRS